MNPKAEFHKTVPVIRDFKLNPSCQHGPTILFEQNNTRFFACSAYRDKKLCSFHMPEERWTGDNDKTATNSPPNKKRKTTEQESLTLKTNQKSTASSMREMCPLQNPTQRDKGEAQYHFTEETVGFFIKQFQNLGITHVLCIGAPSIHEFIRQSPNLESFLLDFDPRLIEKYPAQECALYNMCNHHFFNSKKNYKAFLKGAESLAIITDPPFGAKAELIWNGGLKNCKNDFHKAHKNTAERICEIFWIFPYFNEGHILSKCPDSRLNMSDYKVMYKNHRKFGKTQSKSSPVRIFTTAKLILPGELYRFCDSCERWVDKKNIHCDLCRTCTTKDGGNSYVHCKECKKCVKPTWFHCVPCGSCHLKTALCSTTNPSLNERFKKKNNRKR